MKKSSALKAALFAVSAIMFFFNAKDKAYAEQPVFVELGVAGISKTLNEVFSSGDNTVNDKITKLFNVKLSPYANLGVSVAENYVNIRSNPSTESEIVGKLYRGSAADIKEWLPGDWVQIVSGNVTGYIASNYLAIGKDAEKMVDKYAEKYATVVNTQTLRVREEPSMEARTLELIPLGERYPVLEEHDEWVKILITSDEDGHDLTGYVHKNYVDIEVIFKKAISIEEEQRQIRMQQEAERAEAERLQRLAEEQERKRQEELRRQEEAKKAQEQQKKNEQKQSSKEETPVSTSKGSGTGQQIVEYALKFVGNRYKYGGNSLTNGTDCSGFVKLVYERFGYNLPRQSRSQATQGRKVTADELQPGDLIFYANSKNVVNHVALYIGNGKIVHAANSRQGIITSKYNYRKIYCMRRIIN